MTFELSAGLATVAILRGSRPATLTAAMGTVDTPPADTLSTRALSGLALPFSEPGYTSIGEVTVAPAPGCPDCGNREAVIQWPDELRHVKVVDEHRDPPVPIGYVTAARKTDGGWRVGTYLAKTPGGEAALLEASEGVRDSFSPELGDLEFCNRGHLVGASMLRLALVTTPAWASARHDGLAAAHHTKGITTMTKDQRKRLATLLAQDTHTPEEATEFQTLLAAAREAGDQDGDQDGDGDQGDQDGDGDQGDQDGDGDQATSQPNALAASRGPARLTQHTGTSGRRGGGATVSSRPIRELYASMASVLGGTSRPELEAALSDITATANVWVAEQAYSGELWSGLEYQRRYVPLMMPGDLPARKGTGWRWVVKPEVADYAGDKAAVPSNAPTTEDTEWAAARLAGAHDLDRIFVDFGEEAFIASYYQRMRESYAVKSDDKARAFILANAVASGAAGTTLFHAAAKASQAVFDSTLGLRPDYFLINSADQLDLIDITQNDVPAYLETFGVTPDKFIPTTGVAAGTVVAGTKQAGRFRELAGSPIRVEALNIANGGVDGGVFGYYATEATFDGGIQSATFAAV